MRLDIELTDEQYELLLTIVDEKDDELREELNNDGSNEDLKTKQQQCYDLYLNLLGRNY